MLTGNTIDEVTRTIVKLGGSLFLLKRRMVMVCLLKATGCRRTELVNIEVSSVREALKSRRPMLRVTTVKRGGNRCHQRQIPVKRSDLKLVEEYIEINRRALIRKTCGAENDSGLLFVSSTTGKPLTANHITHEFWKINKLLSKEHQVSAHMFRHRFITKMFAAMVEFRAFESPAAFKKTLLCDLNFQRKLMEWSGHQSPHSLLRYIHPAFEDKGAIETFLRIYVDEMA